MLMKTENGTKKQEFANALMCFLNEHIRPNVLDTDGQWTVKGFIDLFRNIFTISADTKIVSKIIEIHLFPRLLQFAEANNFNVVLAEHQNFYPDMSFVNKDDESIKFAVDIKTTYRNPDKPELCNGFTLGSHGEYFINRDSTKNIQFPYSSYLGHFCLGIIYSRVDLGDDSEREVYRVKELMPDEVKAPEVVKADAKTFGVKQIRNVETLRSITSVVKDFEFFVVEKWQIASDSSGSGNTANIGSIRNIADITKGQGVFLNLGEEVFDDYWMNYGKITVTGADGKPRKITSLNDFLLYRNIDVKLANPKAKYFRAK